MKVKLLKVGTVEMKDGTVGPGAIILLDDGTKLGIQCSEEACRQLGQHVLQDVNLVMSIQVENG